MYMTCPCIYIVPPASHPLFLLISFPPSISYYQLQETDNTSVNSFLTNIISNSLSTLQSSYCITLEEDDRTLQPLTLGCIASYYYLHHTTIRLFRDKLNHRSSFEDLLLLLSVSPFQDTSHPCGSMLEISPTHTHPSLPSSPPFSCSLTHTLSYTHVHTCTHTLSLSFSIYLRTALSMMSFLFVTTKTK